MKMSTVISIAVSSVMLGAAAFQSGTARILCLTAAGISALTAIIKALGDMKEGKRNDD